MKKGVVIGGVIIAVIIIFIIIFQFIPKVDVPFIKGYENYVFDVTSDGKDVLYGQEIKDTEFEGSKGDNCDIYLKNIETKEEKLIKNFDNHCYMGNYDTQISKDKNYLIYLSSLHKGSSSADPQSIYVYDIDQDYERLVLQSLDEGFLEVSFRGIIPSPKENNKFLVTRTTVNFNNTSPPKFIEKLLYELLVFDVNSNEETLIYREEYTEDSDFYEGGKSKFDNTKHYRPVLSRWSPDGEAIIYETGKNYDLAGQLYDYDTEFSNNQYIFYLADEIHLELTPENVKGDISLCGYYYNEDLQSFHDSFINFRFKTFFPDGITYLEYHPCGDPCFSNRYYIKQVESPFCSPIDD